MQNPERPDLPNGRTARYERATTYLLLTLAFYITLTIVDEVWLIRHHHYFAIWARRAADAGVDVSAAVEIASVTAPEQAARKRQVFDMKNDGDFDAFASAVAAAVRA